MFRMPLTGFKLPSRDNSPAKKRPLISSSRSCLARIKILIAMGKSREEPLLMRSAGARLMTILCLGKEKSEFIMALRTRSLDSRMVLSPIPTRLKLGRPLLVVPSTSISCPE